MTEQERLKFCTICTNRKVDFSTGLFCGLTNEKPDFDSTCPSFSKDEKEMERKLNMKLDAAGTSSSQHGSLNPIKNHQYGLILLISGIILTFFISLWFTVMIATGISFMMRASQQKKILRDNDRFTKNL